MFTHVSSGTDNFEKEIAKEKGYAYVFDTAPGSSSVIFAQESDNIMPQVKTKLGIK